MFDVSINKSQSNNILDRSEVKNSFSTFNPNAFYMGRVVDTNDPYKLGRVRVRIPGVHGLNSSESYYIPDNSLPWARPAILNSAGNDEGQFIVPTKGVRVFVSFEANDSNKPIYFGGIPTLINKTKKYNDNKLIYGGEEYDIVTDDRMTDIGEKDSAKTVVYKSFKGSTIIINDEDGKESISIIDAAGQQIIMENESVLPLPRRGDSLNPPSSASITVKTNGTLNLDCNNLDIDAQTTNIPEYVSTTDNDKNYLYTQGTASDTWVITHNLGKYPSVTILDSANNEVEGNIKYLTLNSLQVTFSSAFSGKATLN